MLTSQSKYRSQDDYLAQTLKAITLNENLPQPVRMDAAVTALVCALSGAFLAIGILVAMFVDFSWGVLIPGVLLLTIPTHFKRKTWRATTTSEKFRWRAADELIAVGSALMVVGATGSSVVASFFVVAWICEWYGRLSFRQIERRLS